MYQELQADQDFLRELHTLWQKKLEQLQVRYCGFMYTLTWSYTIFFLEGIRDADCHDKHI